MIKGRCECNGVVFEVAQARASVTACHCGQCRRMSGHFLALTRVATADLTFLSDATLKWYRSSEKARRGFCGDCGATLFFQPQGAAHYGLAVGCLEAPTGMHIGKHIFVDDKGDYYQTPVHAHLFDGYDTPHNSGDQHG